MIVQREIEKIGIPTILIAALPPIARQTGSPRVAAPLVPMGANAGKPNDKRMQKSIVGDALKELSNIDTPGKIVSLPYEYKASI